MSKRPQTPKKSRNSRTVFSASSDSITQNPTAFLCAMSLLLAAEVILERLLGINILTIKINFAFVAVALAAYLYGPLGGALCYGLGDIIGTLLFPAGGYNPLFTLSNVLVGLCFGFFFSGKLNIVKIIIPVVFERTVGTLLLNTLWLKIFFIKSKGFFALMLTRVPEAAFFIVVELIILPPLLLKFGPQLKKLVNK